jgi:antitoxin MazE
MRGGSIMALVKVRQNYQITIPTEVRKSMKVGDYLDVEKKDGDLILKPVKLVHHDQAYFHSREWQEGEAQADRDIAEGKTVGPFDNVDDALDALKKAHI